MSKDKVVLVVSNNTELINGLPVTSGDEHEIRCAQSLEQAVLIYDDEGQRVLRIYLDVQTPRINGGRPGPHAESVKAFIRHCSNFGAEMIIVTEDPTKQYEQVVVPWDVGLDIVQRLCTSK